MILELAQNVRPRWLFFTDLFPNASHDDHLRYSEFLLVRAWRGERPAELAGYVLAQLFALDREDEQRREMALRLDG